MQLPTIAVSAGLIRMISLVQPPPSAKCGNTAELVDGEELRSATGRVVKRNSERSFTSPRRAVTETGFDEVNVNEPANVDAPLKGASSRKFAIWPFAGIVAVPEPASFPFSSVKKNETAAGSPLGLAIANPLRIGPVVRPAIRPRVSSREPGTPASLTNTPF